MKAWTIPQLKKQLKTMDEKQLRELIVAVYKQSKEAKQLINVSFREADYENGIAEEYKEKIYRVFYPKSRSADFSLAKAKKLLKEAETVCQKKENIADVQLLFVECGVEMANLYGDMYESFYRTMATVYRKAVGNVNVNGLPIGEPNKRFFKRCEKILDGSEWMAWGFGEAMTEIYFELDTGELEE